MCPSERPTELPEKPVFADPGEVPVLDWLDKSQIVADPLYQRPLDPARVDTILRSFSWRSFGALVVVPQADGTYHATDGQHRLEAAKLHPKVTHVPAVIVNVEDIPAEASIFVDINKHRKNVTPLELFFAQLAAGDEGALTIQQVCERAGVRIPKHPGNFKPGDSVAVTALHSLVGQVSAMRAREMLQVLAAAEFAPIKAEHIKALAHLMTDDEFAGWITLEDLAVAVKAIGSSGDVEAKRFAATHSTSVWKGLASVWFQKCRKRRAPAVSAAPARPAVLQGAAGTGRASAALPARAKSPAEIAAAKAVAADLTSLLPRSAARRSTVPVAGDPEPGRSALDQRRTA